MKIHKLIEPENVFLGLEARDVRSALERVSNQFAPSDSASKSTRSSKR